MRLTCTVGALHISLTAYSFAGSLAREHEPLDGVIDFIAAFAPKGVYELLVRRVVAQCKPRPHEALNVVQPHCSFACPSRRHDRLSAIWRKRQHVDDFVLFAGLI